MTADLMLRLALAPAAALAGTGLGLLLKGIDRRLSARMQARMGPPLLQPVTDVRKLMLKESLMPRHAVGWLFEMAPVIAFASAMLLLAYIPLGGLGALLGGEGDLVLIMFLTAFPSLALAFGAFASGSRYAAIGGQREMVAIISLELPLAVTVVSAAWLMQAAGAAPAFSLAAISSAPLWGLVGPLGIAGLALLLFVMMMVMPGELGRAPFDMADAETELAGGVLAEYSGRNLALLLLADAARTVAVASLVIALFLPWGVSGLFGLKGIAALSADGAFYIAKMIAVVFVGSVLIRNSVARLRVTQVVKAYWGYGTLISLIGLLLIVLDAAAGVA